MKKKYLFFLFISVLLFVSCGSNKNISYFQDLEQYEYLKAEALKQDSVHVLTIKPNDELSIVVSSYDPKVVAPFNLSGGQNGISSYLVNQEGEINFPTLGKLKVAGLTTEQVISMIQSELKEYVRDPVVNLKIINFKISVLGAVNTPGPFYFTNEKVTLLDAIAHARDLNLYARRDNVLLIRESDGNKEFIRFDLTKSNSVFLSQYFYLQQNDIVYVESNHEKQKDAMMSQQKQFNLTLVSTGVTALISAISLIIAVSNR